MRTRENLVEQIKKLLAMARDKSVTPEEAASFAENAQRLMLKHAIEEADLKEPEIRARLYRFPSRVRWYKLLMLALSEAFLCRCFKAPGQKGAAYFIFGEEENVAALIELFEFLRDELMRLAEKKYDLYAMFEVRPASRRKWKLEFYRGACAMISTRMDMLTRQQQQATRIAGELPAGPAPEQIKSLILIHHDAIEQAVKSFYGDDFEMSVHTRDAFEKRENPAAGAWFAGVRAGQQVALSTHALIE